MVIDIIAFSDAQIAELSAEQVEEVRNAQLKKNRLTEILEKNKEKEKYKLVKRGIFRSGIFEKICEGLGSSYLRDVEDIREGLLFYLRFTSKPQTDTDAPYEVDYSWTYEQRYNAVKGYYDGAFTTGKERFEAFVKDKIAVGYLGEYYAILYDYSAIRAS